MKGVPDFAALLVKGLYMKGMFPKLVEIEALSSPMTGKSFGRVRMQATPARKQKKSRESRKRAKLATEDEERGTEDGGHQSLR